MVKKREIKTYYTADIDKFTAGTKRASGEVDKFSKNADRAAVKLKKSFSGMGAAIAGAISVSALAVMTKNSLDAADAIQKVAQSTGFTIAKVQELRFAADQTGVSMQAIDDVMFRFTKRLGLARTGVKGYSKVYQQLGVDITKTKDQVFNATIDALANMEDQTQATALATRVFGDDAKKILNTFSGGTAGIDAFAKKARDLGLILSDDLVNGAAKANDQLSIMKQVVNIQFTKVFLDLAPAIVAVGNAFTNATTGIRSFYEEFQNARAMTEASEAQREVWRLADSLDEAKKKLISVSRFADTSPDQFGPTVDHWNDQVKKLEVALTFAQVKLDRLKGTSIDKPIIQPTEDTAGGEIPPTGKIKEVTAEYDDLDRALDLIDGQFKELDSSYARQIAGLEKLKTTTAGVTESIRDEWDDVLDIYEQEEAANQRLWARQQAGIVEIDSAADSLEDTYKDLGLTFSSAFEDAIVSGGNLRDMLAGIEEDILRIITRKLVTEPLEDFFGNMFSGGGAGGGIGGFFTSLFTRAQGGSVAAGTPYLVGERGPELFTPSTGGYVTPNNQLAGAGGITINNYITTPDANSFRQSEGQIGSQAAVLIRRAQRNL